MTKQTKQFTKGQKVTYFGPWNNKGVVYFTHAIVHSCGHKQMVLICEESGNVLGRHFETAVGEPDWGGTFPRVSETATKLHGFKYAKNYKAKRIESLEKILSNKRHENNTLYLKSIKEELEEIIADKINVIEHNR